MGRRRLERKPKEERPVVTDDFIYDDDDQKAGADASSGDIPSDTPEDANRKLRARAGSDSHRNAVISDRILYSENGQS